MRSPRAGSTPLVTFTVRPAPPATRSGPRMVWLPAAAMALSTAIAAGAGVVLGVLAATQVGPGRTQWLAVVQAHGAIQKRLCGPQRDQVCKGVGALSATAATGRHDPRAIERAKAPRRDPEKPSDLPPREQVREGLPAGRGGLLATRVGSLLFIFHASAARTEHHVDDFFVAPLLAPHD